MASIFRRFSKSPTFAGVEFTTGGPKEGSRPSSGKFKLRHRTFSRFVSIEDLKFVIDICQDGKWVLSQKITDLEAKRPLHIFFDVLAGLPVVEGISRESLLEKKPKMRTEYEMPEDWRRTLTLSCVASLKTDESVSCEFSATPSRAWLVPQRGLSFPTTYCVEFRGQLSRPGLVRPGEEEFLVVLEGRDSREGVSAWQLVKMQVQVVKVSRGFGGQQGREAQPSSSIDSNPRSMSFSSRSSSFSRSSRMSDFEDDSQRSQDF